MKTHGFILFLTLALGIYLLVNSYIFLRGWQASSWMGTFRYLALALFLSSVFSYPASRLSAGFLAPGVIRFFSYVGSFYLAAMAYLFLALLVIDLVRMANHMVPFLPGATGGPSYPLQKIVFFGLIGGLMTVIGVGHLNTLHPQIRTLEIEIEKPAGNLRDLNIVVASDIHLGKIIGHSRLAEMVERINALHPDLVLFPGDLVDEGGDHLAEGKIVETLRTIRSRFGVFAVTGNHEYYSGLRNALAMMRKGNVKVLEDAVVKVAEAFYLIGRKDRTEDRYGTGRKPLHELIQYVDRRYPVILMDHQPFHLEEASAHGVDLQVSGHTHHGQMFPFNHITRAVYEMSWGYLSKGKTHYYVSCGLGTWGPPVRIGSVPEIVQIKVTFRPR